MTITEQNLEQLKADWVVLKQTNPKLRIRNAAEELGVSELELVMTGLGDNVVRLSDAHGELLQAMEKVGSVMALSRNDQVVHEKHGIYTDFKVAGKGQMGICLGDIDLRVFFSQWKVALYVSEQAGDSVRKSIQFFDGTGTAVHKVYNTGNTHEAEWLKLIDAFTAKDQTAEFDIDEALTPTYPNRGEVTSDTVINEWEALKDVHHFQAMLKRLGISRLETLSLVGERYAKKLPSELAETTLTLAQEREVPIMVFVGNRGIVQIHTGTIKRLLRTGPWFNVLDPDFNLHFNTEEIAQVWLVRRPTAEGVITSVEVYNANDELVLTLFGERKPGVPERDDWQRLVDDLDQQVS